MTVESEKIKPVLPQHGQLFQESMPAPVLCKPKLLPLRSFTLERLETLQKEASETVKEEERQARQQAGALLHRAGDEADKLIQQRSVDREDERDKPFYDSDD